MRPVHLPGFRVAVAEQIRITQRMPDFMRKRRQKGNWAVRGRNEVGLRRRDLHERHQVWVATPADRPDTGEDSGAPPARVLMPDLDNGWPDPAAGAMYTGQVSRPQFEGPANLGFKLGVRAAAFGVVEGEVGDDALRLEGAQRVAGGKRNRVGAEVDPVLAGFDRTAIDIGSGLPYQ